MFDVESLKGALQTLAAALGAMKAAKDLMPASPERDAASKAIEDAERAVRIAEAQAAREFGYPLCGCTFPPQIMLLQSEPGRKFCCSECGRVDDRTPKPLPPPDPRGNW